MWHIQCLLTGLILLASGRLAVAQDSVLDLCELLDRPLVFDGKRVSVRGIIPVWVRMAGGLLPSVPAFGKGLARHSAGTAKCRAAEP
jgi:hypothetical protein